MKGEDHIQMLAVSKMATVPVQPLRQRISIFNILYSLLSVAVMISCISFNNQERGKKCSASIWSNQPVKPGTWGSTDVTYRFDTLILLWTCCTAIDVVRGIVSFIPPLKIVYWILNLNFLFQFSCLIILTVWRYDHFGSVCTQYVFWQRGSFL